MMSQQCGLCSLMYPHFGFEALDLCVCVTSCTCITTAALFTAAPLDNSVYLSALGPYSLFQTVLATPCI